MIAGRLLRLCTLAAALACTHAVFAQQTRQRPSEYPDKSAPPPAHSAGPTRVGEDNIEQARMHFRMGVSFYREGNYQAALVEFKRAYEIAPHYKLKFNIGQTALELKDYAYAIDNLSAYLRDGRNEVPMERRVLVRKMIDELRGRLAMVTIVSNQDGANVYVDDRLVGRTPFERPVPIGAGHRRIVAIKNGFVTVERRVDLAAGDTADLHLQFEGRPAPQPMVVTQVVDEGLHPAAWMLLGTGMLAAGTVALAVLTGVAKAQYEDELARETTAERLEDRKARAEDRALLTDIALGATGAAAIATLVVYLATRDSASEEAPGAASLALQPQLSAGQGRARVGLSGHF